VRRVLHIITTLDNGGAERALYNLIVGGLASTDEHFILSLRDEGKYGQLLSEEGIPVFSLGMKQSIPGIRIINRLRIVIRKVQPDIIQGWMYHGNLASIIAKMMFTRRSVVVWNIRQSLYDLTTEKIMTQYIIKIARFISGSVDKILYNSQLSRQQHEDFGFNKKSAEVIPNGFDSKRLLPNKTIAREQRRVLGIPKDALIIGHIARFHPMKDHVTFLNAAVRVAKEATNVWFVFIGYGVTSDNSFLNNKVPESFKERFLFLGDRDDVTDLMQILDLSCLSSWSEAFPNVLGEAMALGKPCVATDVGDCADIIGDIGFIVPSKDEKAMAEALLAFIFKSKEQRDQMGMAARERIEKKYALPKIVNQYKMLYENIGLNT